MSVDFNTINSAGAYARVRREAEDQERKDLAARNAIVKPLQVVEQQIKAHTEILKRQLEESQQTTAQAEKAAQDARKWAKWTFIVTVISVFVSVLGLALSCFRK